MLNFFTGFFSWVLAGLSLLIILLVLIQRSSGGLGSALGSSAESAFGGQANNVLTRTTIYAVVIFFVLAFGLYLGFMSKNNSNPKHNALPTIQQETKQPGSLTNIP